MNKIIRYILALCVMWITCISHSLPYTDNADQRKTPQKSLELIIHFKAVVNGEPFIAGKNYINSFGESFSIEKFRFYFSKAALVDADTHAAIPLNRYNYSLIDFSDPVSTSLKFSSPPGKYSNIIFLLGVDSIHNVSGAQTGALDPAKGMFWTWNSGYVMAKLEGSSALSDQPGHAITYHIGGYKEPNNVARIINLGFSIGKELEIDDRKMPELNITADINSWFNGPHPLHIREIPTCTTPGVLAKNISENYANMFTIIRP